MPVASRAADFSCCRCHVPFPLALPRHKRWTALSFEEWFADRGWSIATGRVLCGACKDLPAEPPPAPVTKEPPPAPAPVEKPGPAWARRPAALHAMRRNLVA